MARPSFVTEELTYPVEGICYTRALTAAVRLHLAGDPHVKRRDLIACTLPLVAQIGLGCLGMVGTHAHNIRFERQHVFNTHEVRP